MKKFFSILFVFVLVLSGVSCSYIKDPPYGVWESSNPHLIIYFEREDTRDGYGYYYKSGETIEILIMQRHDGSFDVYDKRYFEEDDMDYQDPYFRGPMKIKKDGKLYYTMKGTFPETAGYDIDVIIFDKIEER